MNLEPAIAGTNSPQGDTETHERTHADREAYKPVKAILDAWDAWAPTRVPTCPATLVGRHDEVAETLRVYRNGATVDDQARRIALMYSDWRNQVTDAESANIAKLEVLITACETMGTLHKRHPQSKKLEHEYMKFITRVGGEYGMKAWAKTKVERHLDLRGAVINLRAMPEVWRKVVHVGGC